jgi:cytochrome P450
MTTAEAQSAGPDYPPREPVADFDPYAPSTRAENDAAWARLRAKCPVAWSERRDAWLVAGYEENASAFRNWEVFRSGREVKTVPGGPGGSPDFSSSSGGRVRTTIMSVPEELDPPEWHDYRRMIGEVLSPRAVTAFAPRLDYNVTRFIDEFIETGRCDLIDDLTGPVPGALVLEWLGFPEADWRRISHAMHVIVGTSPGSPNVAAAVADMEWVRQRVREEVADRRAHPRDDGISALVNRTINGTRIPLEYAEGLIALAVGGGVDTTTASTTSALVHLHFHPGDRRALIDRPELMDSAIEEFLRVYPPARTHGRTAVQDTELGGCLIRKDDRIIMSEVSASHDEAQFPDGDKFVLDRFPNRHLAFGVGLHRCPGSHLARLQMKAMLTQVLVRMPDFRLMEEQFAEHPNWGAMAGYLSVPAVFTAGRRWL